MELIGIISGKGGVGKTTNVANLGAALSSEFKKRTLVVDCNFESPDLPIYFGMCPLPASRKKVVEGRAIFVHPSGVHCMPSSSIDKSSASELKEFLVNLDYHFVLLDSPPVGYELVLKLSDSILVVTNPDVLAVSGALKAIKRSEQRELAVLGVEINRVRKRKYEVSYAELVSVFDTPLIATVPESKHIPKALAEGCPTVLRYPHCRAAIEFKKLAASLVGREYKVGVLGKVLSACRR